MHAHTHAHTHACTHTHMHTHTHARTHTHACTCTHTHTHTHSYISGGWGWNDKEKWSELTHDSAWYVRDTCLCKVICYGNVVCSIYGYNQYQLPALVSKQPNRGFPLYFGCVIQLRSIGCDVMSISLFSYLVARDSASQKPVGFINFRFDLEEGVEVVYWCVGTTVCLSVSVNKVCIPFG